MTKRQNLFGTDGVRGKVGIEPITVESFLALGQAIGHYFSTRRPSRHIRHKIVIGKDTRRSNYMLEQAVSAGICSMGVDSMLLGPIPTPGISFITQSMRADAGIVISASHNLFQFNGLKVFDETGEKITHEQEDEIRQLYDKFRNNVADQTPGHVGKCKRLDDVLGRYIVHLKYFFPRHLSLEGFRVMLDCADGATYKVAPITFEELGCDLHCTAIQPNGQNINDGVGSTYLDAIRQEILRDQSFDIGFAFDGDGDRCLMVSKSGNIFDGDRITAMVVHYYRVHLKRDPFPVVLTGMSNSGLVAYLKSLGCDVRKVAVGDRNVHMEMKKTKALIGSEPSGHVIFGDQFNTGDGILTAINVLRVLTDMNKSADDLFDLYTQLPSVLVNVDVKHKPPFEKLPKTSKLIMQVQKDIGDLGQVLVRYSGTEPLARIKIEGQDEQRIKELANSIAESIRLEVND